MAISDHFEASIGEVKVSFGYTDFEEDPDEITAALGLEPSEVRRAGEVLELPGQRDFRVPFNSWSIVAGSSSKDVNEQLRELLARLLPNADAVRRFADPGFGVLWKGGSNGPFYEPDALEGIARLGATLYQDIYVE